ncbi:Tetratricopeptide repeat (TPR)-like superfamily protein [Euphorbia peplus]|nr:Tetratricopeptide repeat (TPR)-like superfamily protein [Euphorbia peplus]
MIYAHRLSTLLRNEVCSSFHSMASRRSTNTSPWQSLTTELYRRINPIGDPTVSVVPVLNQWVEEGRSVHQESLKDIIRKLRSSRRFHHALEVSMWMTDKQYHNLTPSDAAIRLGLISKAKGIEQAEKYFNNLSQKLKEINVYGALLHCYGTAECVEKAEAVIQKMRDLGFAMQILDCNVMLTLYYKTKNVEKLDALLKEMEKNGVVPDRITLGIQLSVYADAMDSEGIDKIVVMMESDRKIVPNWIDYIVAATGYRKAGLLDKALEMLKKAEACVPSNGRHLTYDNLMTHYATIGMKDEVLRLWSLYKKGKVYNKGYARVLKSLVTLGDFEMVEQIFNEWELQDLIYDMHIPNIMIRVYSKKGLLEKAEAILDRAILKGGKPDAWTWYNLVEGYLQNDQSQTVEVMKKTILLSTNAGRKLDVARLKARLKFLKDAEKTEEFVKLLIDKDFFSLDKLEEEEDLLMDRDESVSCG